MLKSADLHETLLTPIICHKHVRCHDGVTLYLSMKFPSIAPNKTSNGHFWIYQQISAHSKLKQKNNKKRRNPQLNARKHSESKSRNRSLSVAVQHVKPSRHNSNLFDSRENHHKVDILIYSVCLQCRKRNKDFITINF